MALSINSEVRAFGRQIVVVTESHSLPPTLLTNCIRRPDELPFKPRSELKDETGIKAIICALGQDLLGSACIGDGQVGRRGAIREGIQAIMILYTCTSQQDLFTRSESTRWYYSDRAIKMRVINRVCPSGAIVGARLGNIRDYLNVQLNIKAVIPETLLIHVPERV
ncbi:MAG: hypothetical protein M1812_001765 [Candelaria pacifica]|nr:MAG: hypothetical protein M1812_001765 [Candelaria pacifica]